jgi:hypothetical protein
LPIGDENLQAFIRSSVRSVWALELLLLLKRTPDREWAADALVRELRASDTVVSDALSHFETTGLVRRGEGGYAYAPVSPVLAECCDALERLYRERPVAVVNLIASTRSKLQSFADAFRLKGEPE